MQSAPAKTASISESLPFSLPLELTVKDPDVIAELCARAEGAEREEYALGALRLGVLALRQARGQLDANTVRREGEKFLSDVQAALGEHRAHVDRTLAGTLKDYFDPENGRFNERVERLLKKDGELETLISRKITAEDSEMCRVLTAHLGEDSPLFKLLSPTESEGLLKALRESVAAELISQRTEVLKEFSLDNSESALSRLVGQMTDRNGKLSADLQKKIDEMLKQFSFDEEESALSRMKRTVDSTSEVITKHLTLDDEKSALSRLRHELMEVLNQHGESSQKFQAEVRGTLEKMQVRRDEAAKSTRHGIDFEAQLVELLGAECQKSGDVATFVGNSAGLIKNCKKGDVLIELGPDNVAAGARIAVEAKDNASYDLAEARTELAQARENRGAEVGIFAFSKKTAPPSLDCVGRYGNDIVVVWDSDDATTDLHVKLALSLARALCTRKALERTNISVDFTEIDKALTEISTQLDALERIRPMADTIKEQAEKILDRLRISLRKLAKQGELLTERISDLKQVVAEQSQLKD
ncbi:MAG: hypothetical protein HYS13_21320 [Planctomycetia bacterium]|nr:hypothetical protein [Planctomycetia bacterium]